MTIIKDPRYTDKLSRECVSDDHGNKIIFNNIRYISDTTIETKRKHRYYYHNMKQCGIEYIINKDNNELVQLIIYERLMCSPVTLIKCLRSLLIDIMNDFGNLEVCDIISEYITTHKGYEQCT